MNRRTILPARARTWIAGSTAAVLLGASAFAGAVVTAGPAAADPPSGGTAVTDETFEGSTVTDPAWTVQGDACLTGTPEGQAAPADQAQIPDCSAHQVVEQQNGPHPGPPTVGGTPGYLQMTDAAGFARGSILYNTPLPSSAGISFTFDKYQYGGTGADGIGFFLVDGATDLTAPGADGGSLGYAQRNGTPGIGGGYLGVGMDSYGNFYDDGEARGNQCPAGQRSTSFTEGPAAPNVVTLRGPGNGTTGYCFLTSTVEQPVVDPERPVSTLHGSLRGDTLEASERTINVQVTPKTGDEAPQVIVQVQYAPGGPWVEELRTVAPKGTPSTYKFGLSASTGGSTDIHLVRGVKVRTIDPLNELNLEKAVDRSGEPLPAVITPGTKIPYVYTVTNAGQEPVSALSITDDKIDTGDITCPTDPLPPAPAQGSTVTCHGTYTVTAADAGSDAVTNVATAHGTAPVAGDVDSNDATVTVPLTSALTLDKSVTTPGPYAVGQDVQYSYEVTNTGGSALRGVAVTDDKLPGADQVVCDAGVLAAGASTTCTGTYTVAADDVDDAGEVTNTAYATAETALGQQVTSPEDRATIGVATDVAVTKTVDDDTPVVGDDVTYTVTATNDGPSLAQDVVVTDDLPAGLTFVSAASPDADPVDYDEDTGAWSVGDLEPGDAATLHLTATVGAGSEITNTATRTGMVQQDTDPSNDSASATIDPVTPTLDIAVHKSVLDADGAPQPRADVPAGSPATFRVTATNDGPFDGTGVTLTDALPQGLTYDADASGGDGTYDAKTGTWTIGDLAEGDTATYDFVVGTTRLGDFTNVATLSASTPSDTDPDNDTASATLTVRGPESDLGVTKSVDPAEGVVVGDTVTYTVEATNHGDETVGKVVVRDEGPKGVDVVPGSADVTQGSVDDAVRRWQVGTLEPGQTARLTVQGTVTGPGTHTNTVTIDSRAAGFVDTDPDNDSDSAELATTKAPLDIAVTKKAAAVTPGVPVSAVPLGDQVAYTITATNLPAEGDAGRTATGLVLSDVFPDGMTITSSDTQDGTFDPSSGDWTVGTLGANDTATLTVTATADAVGPQKNVVSLNHVDQRDTDRSNNRDTARVNVVALSDLVLTKDVSTPTAQPGDGVDWTVTVRNDGPDDNSDVTVADPGLAAGGAAEVTDVDAPDGTTFDRATGTWTVGDLPDGASRTLTVGVVVPAGASGTVRNTAQIASHAVRDPDRSNDKDSAVYRVPVADVAVTEAVDRPVVAVGDTVTFTVDVDNLGPDPAEAVDVDGVLPDGLTYVSSEATVGSLDTGTSVWTVGDLDVARAAKDEPQAQLTVVATVDEAATMTSTVKAPRDGSHPYDPVLVNNADSATVTAAAATADLAVTKSVDQPQVGVGGTVTYTLGVTNLGPGTATDATLEDPFPAGVVPTAAHVTGEDGAGDGRSCTVEGQDVACDLGDLAVGDDVTVTVTATGAKAGEHTNTATVATTALDPVAANDTASADLTVVGDGGPTPGGGGSDGGSGGAGGSPDHLGVTGADVLPWLAGALVLLVVGGGLVVVSRRRRG
ncbi:DUF11 domain-containing protein [Cellulomonas sp. PhB143]|uniref:DUF7507 domain-containing protein n=1 Tax=Cellulomonas sp. PhB143 TaxID=2485186 RepID=UPI000F4AB425|nr:DUF11 domain-containing protein [Cellulomonas sp. PhB143]ROS75295.1 putative repeat protein (TIGR01451 family) [Cellulomonas sp. PhB143]